MPLSHVAAQMLDIHCSITYITNYNKNCTVYFADNMALRGTLKNTLLKAKPTIFFGVPRVWEKFMEAIKESAKKNPATGCKKSLINWCKSKSNKNLIRLQNNSKSKNSPFLLSIAQKVLTKVKLAIGLDQCVLFFTGAAPIGKETLEFFGNLDIQIMEL